MKAIFKWIFGGSRADRLLLAATVVAGVRMMLISAVFIGFDLEVWPWFKPAEVWSGLAYAVLEGVALAYVSQLWVKLRPSHYVEWGYWGILAVGQLLLLATIIGVTGFAAAAVRRETSVDVLLGDAGAVAWSMFVTALNPLMVILIGIARAIDPAEDVGGTSGGRSGVITIRRDREDVFSVDVLAKSLIRLQPNVTPDTFAAILRDNVGVSVTTDEAEAALAAARNGLPPVVHGGNGRRKGAV
jgi:hypothetical protein